MLPSSQQRKHARKAFVPTNSSSTFLAIVSALTKQRKTLWMTTFLVKLSTSRDPAEVSPKLSAASEGKQGQPLTTSFKMMRFNGQRVRNVLELGRLWQPS